MHYVCLCLALLVILLSCTLAIDAAPQGPVLLDLHCWKPYETGRDISARGMIMTTDGRWWTPQLQVFPGVKNATLVWNEK